MPRFMVTKLVDAYVEYTTEVEAESASHARELARSYLYAGDWVRENVREYDDAVFPEDEVAEVIIR